MTILRHSRSCSIRGFTLVEILIVVVIIVSMAAIAYSGSRTMITRARIIESSANLRSLAIANTTYLADHGTYCPASDQSNNRRWHGSRSSKSQAFDPRKGFLSPYLGESMQVTICPLFRAMVEGAASFENSSGGYGYNSSYIGGTPGGMFDPITRILVPQRPANVVNPANTVMFTTTAYARGAGLQEYPYCEPPFWDFGGGPTGMRPAPSVHFRAAGRALVAWCDGSVTAEIKNHSRGGANPHGGDAEAYDLGWFGPEENNGYWNPRN